MARPRQERRIKHGSRMEKETWLLTDYYCKDCGKRDVWQHEGDDGDYYVGASGECLSCHATMDCLDVIKDTQDQIEWWRADGR